MDNIGSLGAFKPYQPVKANNAPKNTTPKQIQNKYLTKNLRTLSREMDASGKIDPSRMRIIEKNVEGTIVKVLTVSNKIQRLGNHGKRHQAEVEGFIGQMELEIEAKDRNDFSPSLKAATARYNQQLRGTEEGAHEKRHASVKRIQLRCLTNPNIADIQPKNLVGIEKRGPGVITRKDRTEPIQQKRGLVTHTNL